MATLDRQASRLPSELSTEAGLMATWLKACRESVRSTQVLNLLVWNARLKRLFAVSCCRVPVVWSQLPDERSRNAVEVAERFVDGLASKQELDAASSAAYAAAAAAYYASSVADYAAYAAYYASYYASSAADYAAYTSYYAAYYADLVNAQQQEWERQGGVIIAIVRPEWEFEASWRTETVVGIAEETYRLRAWDRLPILADALEDAGCDDRRILTWAREGDLWFPGEWLVDQARGVRS